MAWPIKVMGWFMSKRTRPFLYSLFLRKIDALFPNARQMTCQQLQRLLVLSRQGPAENKEEVDVVLVDTRPESEYIVSHLEGALRFTEASALHDHLVAAGKDPANTRVIAYCSVGYRSSVMAQALAQKYGWAHAYNLRGSLFQWIADDLPAVREEPNGGGNIPVRYCHPFDEEYGIFLDKEFHHTT